MPDEDVQETQAVPETPQDIEIDAKRVIGALQRQLSAASLEIAKRDALLEQVQEQARSEILSYMRVVEAQVQEINRLKGIVGEEVVGNGHIEEVPSSG